MKKYITPDGREISMSQVLAEGRIICNNQECECPAIEDEFSSCDNCGYGYCLYCWQDNGFHCLHCGECIYNV